jgi:hypothetical protein
MSANLLILMLMRGDHAALTICASLYMMMRRVPWKTVTAETARAS